MESNMKPTFKTTRPALRTLFVAIALLATFSTGAIIDRLVQHYHADAAATAPTTPVVVAAHASR
jgi:hypothetical protein